MQKGKNKNLYCQIYGREVRTNHDKKLRAVVAFIVGVNVVLTLAAVIGLMVSK